MQRRSMCAFTAPAARAPLLGSTGSAAISARPVGTVPFFASNAFGAPVASRARVAVPAVPDADIVPNGAGNMRMDVTVVVGDGEPIESAIRRFKKEVTKSGHLYELRRRRYFETNTEKRLRKAAAARRKARMARNMKRKNQGNRRNANAKTNNDKPAEGVATAANPANTSTPVAPSAPARTLI